MFGLEGSGFMISLAMTFFLVGLVMYYVRQRFNDQEKQLNQVVSIIPVMSQQLQIHESILKSNQPSMPEQQVMGGPGNAEIVKDKLYGIPEENEKINVSDNDVEESDTESEDTEDTDEESDDDDHEIKNINLGRDIPDITVADIETELGNQLQAMAMQGGLGQVRVVSVHTMESEEPDDLVNNIHNIELIDEDDKKEGEDESNSESDSESEADTDSEEDGHNNSAEVTIDAVELDNVTQLEEVTQQESHNVEPPVEQTKVIKAESANIDYSRMAVAALREIVVSRGLADAGDASKLKKKKLVELLK